MVEKGGKCHGRRIQRSNQQVIQCRTDAGPVLGDGDMMVEKGEEVPWP